jgi:hypothetical protein
MSDGVRLKRGRFRCSDISPAQVDETTCHQMSKDRSRHRAQMDVSHSGVGIFGIYYLCKILCYYLVLALLTRAQEHPRQLQKAPIPLLRLRHLAIDTQSHSPSTTPALWGQIFNVIQPWSLPLTSIVLKMSHRLVVGESFIQFLAAGYGNTLTNLAFINCAVTVEALQCIALRCRKLRRLAFPVQHSEIVRSIFALYIYYFSDKY